MNLQRLFVGVLGLGMMLAAPGCAPKSEYDAQVMSNRKLREQLEQARLELQDARSQAELARAKAAAYDTDMEAKNKLIASLQSERDQHLEAFRRAQRALEEMASRKPQDPIVLTQALPAELDSALRDFAARHPEAIEFDSRTGVVKWKSDLLFALGSDVVIDSAKPALAEFAGIMKSAAASNFDVTIVGHTDNTRIARAETKSKHPTNWHLSVHRSISVMDVLAGQGLPEQRIGVMGYGELRPIAPNTNNDSKARNRRVEIFVVPRGSVSLADTGARRASAEPQMQMFTPSATK